MLGDTVLQFGGEVHPKGSLIKAWWPVSGFGESEWTTRLQPPQWIQKLTDYVSVVGPGWRA